MTAILSYLCAPRDAVTRNAFRRLLLLSLLVVVLFWSTEGKRTSNRSASGSLSVSSFLMPRVGSVSGDNTTSLRGDIVEAQNRDGKHNSIQQARPDAVKPTTRRREGVKVNEALHPPLTTTANELVGSSLSSSMDVKEEVTTHPPASDGAWSPTVAEEPKEWEKKMPRNQRNSAATEAAHYGAPRQRAKQHHSFSSEGEQAKEMKEEGGTPLPASSSVSLKRSATRGNTEPARSSNELTSSTSPFRTRESPQKKYRSNVLTHKCEEATMDFLYRSVYERREVERAYESALGYANELQTNYTLFMERKHGRSAPEPAFYWAHGARESEKLGSQTTTTKEEKEIQLRKAVQMAKAEADRRYYDLLLYDARTWTTYGGEVGDICFQEADAFRFFLLNHKTKEQVEDGERRAGEQQRTEGKKWSENTAKRIRNFEQGREAVAEFRHKTLSEKLLYTQELLVSSLFPPIFLIQQVTWAVWRYHLWEFRKALYPWLQRHELAWLVVAESRTATPREGKEAPARPLSHIIAPPIALDDRDLVDSMRNDFASASQAWLWTVMDRLALHSQSLWMWFVLMGMGTVVLGTLPIVLLVLYCRDVLYHMFFCRIFLQHVLGFTKPLSLVRMLKSALIDPDTYVEEINEVAHHLSDRFEQRHRIMGSYDALLCIETAVLLVPLTMLVFFIADRWMRLNLAFLW